VGEAIKEDIWRENVEDMILLFLIRKEEKRERTARKALEEESNARPLGGPLFFLHLIKGVCRLGGPHFMCLSLSFCK
jgi:hypothetical protein